MTRNFLGNIKGEKGDKGDPGSPGIKLIDSEIIVNVPEQFPSIQEAIDHLSSNKNKNNIKSVINVSNDFIETVPIKINDTDLSFIEIKGSFKCDIETDHFIEGRNSVMPIFSCLVDMQGKGGSGYYVTKNCRGIISDNCGVINAGVNGIFISGTSSIDTNRCNFSGALNRCVWVARASSFNAEYSNFNECKGDNAIYISMGSSANLVGSDISYNDGNGVVSVGSLVNIRDCTIKNNGKTGAISQKGGSLRGENAIITDNNVNGVVCELGSSLYFINAKINNNLSSGIRMTGNSNGSITNSEILNNSRQSVYVADVSSVNLRNSKVGGGSLVSQVESNTGSNILLYNVTLEDGSDIDASYTSSTNFNEVNGLRGIIYK